MTLAAMAAMTARTPHCSAVPVDTPDRDWSPASTVSEAEAWLSSHAVSGSSSSASTTRGGGAPANTGGGGGGMPAYARSAAGVGAGGGQREGSSSTTTSAPSVAVAGGRPGGGSSTPSNRRRIAVGGTAGRNAIRKQQDRGRQCLQIERRSLAESESGVESGAWTGQSGGGGGGTVQPGGWGALRAGATEATLLVAWLLPPCRANHGSGLQRADTSSYLEAFATSLEATTYGLRLVCETYGRPVRQ